jgi:DNA-binding PadR family transcriptional regulator
MSTRLAVLGVLEQQPLHGYEVKRIVEERMGGWTAIAFGSIYFALRSLTQEGLVEIARTERAGNRPSRTIYAITDRGRAEFLVLLRSEWQRFERVYFPVDLAVFFAGALPPSEVKGYIQRRAKTLQGVLEHVQAHRAERADERKLPPVAQAIFGHSLGFLEAELAWTRTLSKQLRSNRRGRRST